MYELKTGHKSEEPVPSALRTTTTTTTTRYVGLIKVRFYLEHAPRGEISRARDVL